MSMPSSSITMIRGSWAITNPSCWSSEEAWSRMGRSLYLSYFCWTTAWIFAAVTTEISTMTNTLPMIQTRSGARDFFVSPTKSFVHGFLYSGWSRIVVTSWAAGDLRLDSSHSATVRNTKLCLLRIDMLSRPASRRRWTLLDIPPGLVNGLGDSIVVLESSDRLGMVSVPEDDSSVSPNAGFGTNSAPMGIWSEG